MATASGPSYGQTTSPNGQTAPGAPPPGTPPPRRRRWVGWPHWGFDPRGQNGQRPTRVPLGRRIAVAIAIIGGARADGLAQVPGATGGFIGMAFVLAFTSIVAGLSAATALTIALHARLWVAIALGAFWSLLIFNLDRLLIVTLSKNSSKTFRITGIAFRIFLAACLSIIISTPVTLLVFQKEINRELAIQQTAQVSAYQAQQATLTSGKQLLRYETKLNADQSRLSTGNFDTPSDAQHVASDVKKQQLDYQTYLSQQALTEGEAACTAGSHHVGCSQICMLDEAQESQDLTQYQADLNQTKADRSTEAADAVQEKRRVETDVITLTNEIDAIKNAQAASLSSYAQTTANSDGLLARIEALWASCTNLTAASPTCSCLSCSSSLRSCPSR